MKINEQYREEGLTRVYPYVPESARDDIKLINELFRDYLRGKVARDELDEKVIFYTSCAAKRIDQQREEAGWQPT